MQEAFPNNYLACETDATASDYLPLYDGDLGILQGTPFSALRKANLNHPFAQLKVRIGLLSNFFFFFFATIRTLAGIMGELIS